MENPLTVVPEAEGIGLRLILFRDTTLMGGTQQVPNLMGSGGIGAIGIARGFINGQPLYGGRIGTGVWHTVFNANGGDPTGIVIVRNVFAQRDHKIGAIKSTVTLDICKRRLRVKHLIEHIFLQHCRINLKRFHGHDIDTHGDLAVSHGLIGDLCYQIGNRLRGVHADLVVKEHIQRRRA